MLTSLEKQVTDLYEYRDTYLGAVLDKDMFTSDIIPFFQPWLTTENANTDSLQKHLTDLIRHVVQVKDCKENKIGIRIKKLLIESENNESLYQNNLTLIDKAQIYYLRGKALNVLPVDAVSVGHQSEAKMWLLKSVKFNPTSSDALCELAEREWMEGEPKCAISSLQSALSNDTYHSESLWKLSMLLRQLPGDTGINSLKKSSSSSTEVTDINLSNIIPSLGSKEVSGDFVNSAINSPIYFSVRLAHAAVKAAPTSGRAWECLGNALLTSFLTGSSRSDSVVTRCLAALSQASKDPKVVMEPHFHYNRGIAWLYQDDFNQALTSWLRSALLDPAWPTPRACAMRLAIALIKISSQCNACPDGHLKQRQINDLIVPLAPTLLCSTTTASTSSANLTSKTANLDLVLGKLLGPYFNQEQIISSDLRRLNRKAKNTSKIPKLNFFLFNQLKVGSNIGSVCCGRVVCNLPGDTDLAINSLLIDAQGNLIILRIFQIGKGLGPSVKDSIAIPDPFVEICPVNSNLLRLVLTFDLCVRSEGGDSEDDDLVADDLEIKSHLCTLNNLSDIRLRIIRVPTPAILCLNGRRIGRAWAAPVMLKSVFFTSA